MQERWGWGSGPLWEESRGGHELEQLEWLHRRRVSTWDCEEVVTDLLTQVYFWYVSLLGPLTCLQKTLSLPKPSVQSVPTCPENTGQYGDNMISSVTGTFFTAQGRPNCIQLPPAHSLVPSESHRLCGAIWVYDPFISLTKGSYAACPKKNNEASYITHPPKDLISLNLRGGFTFSLQPFYNPFVAPITAWITKEFFIF